MVELCSSSSTISLFCHVLNCGPTNWERVNVLLILAKPLVMHSFRLERSKSTLNDSFWSVLLAIFWSDLDGFERDRTESYDFELVWTRQNYIKIKTQNCHRLLQIASHLILVHIGNLNRLKFLFFVFSSNTNSNVSRLQRLAIAYLFSRCVVNGGEPKFCRDYWVNRWLSAPVLSDSSPRILAPRLRKFRAMTSPNNADAFHQNHHLKSMELKIKRKMNIKLWKKWKIDSNFFMAENW